MWKKNFWMKMERKRKQQKYNNIIIQRVTKDKDGNDIVEEVIVDEFGNKTTKK